MQGEEQYVPADALPEGLQSRLYAKLLWNGDDALVHVQHASGGLTRAGECIRSWWTYGDLHWDAMIARMWANQLWRTLHGVCPEIELNAYHGWLRLRASGGDLWLREPLDDDTLVSAMVALQAAVVSAEAGQRDHVVMAPHDVVPTKTGWFWAREATSRSLTSVYRVRRRGINYAAYGGRGKGVEDVPLEDIEWLRDLDAPWQVEEAVSAWQMAHEGRPPLSRPIVPRGLHAGR